MNIENIIENPVVEKEGLFFLKGHGKFGYNDGDEIENYILNSVIKADNISSDSRELEKNIKDWPSLYHFSRNRTLAYQSLNIPVNARILEVGSGCGAITRFLGEKASAVLALEGSPRRAAITRARTRDLDSVQVLCASFENVVFKNTFDIVVCNGVLEYASFFVKHAQPHQLMLKLLSALLAPGGSLIIAIENQIGLRYFTSGKEEHTGMMFDGLEGYPRMPDGARTFGAKVLERMLHETFSSVEMLLPLPDYKLPNAIIRAKLPESVNCSELFANNLAHNFGTYVRPQMHERLVWSELQKNGLTAEFATSFFMIAGEKKTSLLDSNWMGDIYSIRRKREWAIRTRIATNAEGAVYTEKSYLEPNIERGDVPFAHYTVAGNWMNGESIHTAVVRALLRKGKISLEDRLREPVLAWWAAVKADGAPTSGKLDGATLDHHWQNAFVEQDQVHFIDQEWAWKEPIDIIWLLYRTVANFANDETYYIHILDKSCRNISTYKLMRTVAKIIGVEVSLRAFLQAVRQEQVFQEAVIGRRLNMVKMVVWAFESLLLRQRRFLLQRLVRRVTNKISRM